LREIAQNYEAKNGSAPCERKDNAALKRDVFESSSKDFIIRIVGRQHATWQGTITLTNRRATQTARLPQTVKPAGIRNADTMATVKETYPFRSMLELIHLIDSALCEEEDGNEARRSER
jgi:citrate lyase beta subunit